MTIPTLRTPKGKMTHAMKGTVVYVSGQTGMAEVMCGKEYTGITGDTESPEGVTCPRCHDRIMAELAADLAEQEQQEEHADAMVLGTPETIREPRRRYRSPGRIRHGKVIQERADRRRRMKELLTRV